VLLSLITDDVAVAVAAERAGIDRIMIDLERDGKARRQADRNLFLSTHRLESVGPVKAALTRASLLVRINPLSERTPGELDAVLAAGADVIMLPYFFTAADARSFVAMVGGRARVCLLVETKSAVDHLADCLADGTVDEVHIGLNDLSIDLGCVVMLEPMCNGVIDQVAAALRGAGIPFGVGGLARLSAEELPVRPERLLAEQVRLGCTRAWLGRTFREGLRASHLSAEVACIREAIARWRSASAEASGDNRRALADEIMAWKRSLERGLVSSAQLPKTRSASAS
jgi:citrate lyase beta subunit